MSLSEQLIYCTTKIIVTKDNNQVATGTGFFMDFNEDKQNNTCQPVIITNKHVVENALLEKKQITPTLAICFFLEQKHELGFDEIFNNISFVEKENCDMFVDDENQMFNINFKAKSFIRLENDVDKYNYDMMKNILHELTHIYQFTRTEESENAFDRLVYYDYHN